MSEGGPPNLSEVMQTAQRMQQEIQKIQQELANKVVEGSAAGGLVSARANGRHQLVSISFDQEMLSSGDIEMLKDLIVAAVNQALEKASELAQQELSKVAGGLPIKITGLM